MQVGVHCSIAGHVHTQSPHLCPFATHPCPAAGVSQAAAVGAAPGKRKRGTTDGQTEPAGELPVATGRPRRKQQRSQWLKDFKE